jgi:hypothetical protein
VNVKLGVCLIVGVILFVGVFVLVGVGEFSGFKLCWANWVPTIAVWITDSDGPHEDKKIL